MWTRPSAAVIGLSMTSCTTLKTICASWGWTLTWPAGPSRRLPRKTSRWWMRTRRSTSWYCFRLSTTWAWCTTWAATVSLATSSKRPAARKTGNACAPIWISSKSIPPISALTRKRRRSPSCTNCSCTARGISGVRPQGWWAWLSHSSGWATERSFPRMRWSTPRNRPHSASGKNTLKCWSSPTTRSLPSKKAGSAIRSRLLSGPRWTPAGRMTHRSFWGGLPGITTIRSGTMTGPPLRCSIPCFIFRIPFAARNWSNGWSHLQAISSSWMGKSAWPLRQCGSSPSLRRRSTGNIPA